MSRLRYRPWWFARRDDGGVASIVGILAATGVLLATAALTVDVGQLYAEREDLQNGADAAAMAIALDCSHKRVSECQAASATAEDYANRTARDGQADPTRVCGQDRTGWLPPCSAMNLERNATACIGSRPASGINYVEVYVRTERPVSSDRYILPPSFAQTLLGGTTAKGVGACARVAYGPPKHGLAFTINVCEALAAENKVVPYSPWPPSSSDWGREVYLGVHGPAGRTCNPGTPPSGWSLPGGYDWLDEVSLCQFVLGDDGIYGGGSGSPPSQDCKDALDDLRDSARIVAIPVYRWERGTGSNIEYQIDHYMPFVVTGYHLPGLSDPSIVTGDDPCSGNDTCIYGFVLPFDAPIQDEVGEAVDGDLKLSVIKTIG
ncbi:pilus assembly protein TadG-related protein [Hamadaea sp. NPDC050747]|uniref:pilus assembly protein TadG-related protein n=1 Tax=Hamadaea sp. NPDC050747 TaxID=3155789 RepID=UPI0033FDD881